MSDNVEKRFETDIYIYIYIYMMMMHELKTLNIYNRPDRDQQHCYHHAPKVKPVAATAVVEFLMMGARTPETC